MNMYTNIMPLSEVSPLTFKISEILCSYKGWNCESRDSIPNTQVPYKSEVEEGSAHMIPSCPEGAKSHQLHIFSLLRMVYTLTDEFWAIRIETVFAKKAISVFECLHYVSVDYTNGRNT